MKGKKKVLITGGTGLLGYSLIKSVPDCIEPAYTFFPSDKKDSIAGNLEKYYLDVRDNKQVLDVVRAVRPDYLIHTASLASVDYVENNKEESKAVNLGGTSNIVKACRHSSTELLYISSNAVFDGEDPPYAENDTPNPINYYGKLKLEEESLVKKSGISYSVIRPILMYGWNIRSERKNAVTWLIEELKSNKQVNMVDDIFCNPLFADDCAETIWKIISLEKNGIFHIGGKDEISRYEFARITAEIFGLNKDLISPVKNAFFKGIAPRPKNTTYNIGKTEKELGIRPLGIRKGLMKMRETGQ